jgi:primosomal protein N' (replication factor Y) (superfamily II helicase)
MIAQVALPLPLYKSFSYTFPESWTPLLENGIRVRVPFRQRTMTGVVVECTTGDGKDLKEVQAVLDPFPPGTGPSNALSIWASRYYATPLGVVLRYALPPPLLLERFLTVRSLPGTVGESQVLTMGKTVKLRGREATYLRLREGLIQLNDRLTGLPYQPIKEAPATSGSERTLLLDTVERRLAVYEQEIERRIEKGEKVLLLLADHVAAGSYFAERLKGRFGQTVFWFGSAVRQSESMEAFFRARSDGGGVILGNKSAAFLPFRDLSLIIVDRCEDDGFHNEASFRFHAATVARERADLEKISLILGTAAPSLELHKLAGEGLLEVRGAGYPPCRAPSTFTLGRLLQADGGLPQALIGAVEGAVGLGQSVALFTPRRDYATRLRCLSCRQSIVCPRCRTPLSYRKAENVLVCGVCNHQDAYEDRCPDCGSDLIAVSQTGAEYLAERLQDVFPDVHVIKYTHETPKRQEQMDLKESVQGPFIVVGTHVLSKLYGFHLPRLILVAWEELIRVGGYRATERAFQVVMNLLDALTPCETLFAIEEGRGLDPGVFLEPQRFYKEELDRRASAGFPPFGRMILVESEKKAEKGPGNSFDSLREKALGLGLMAGLSAHTGRGRPRWRLMVKGDEGPIASFLETIAHDRGLRIETDPLNI